MTDETTTFDIEQYTESPRTKYLADEYKKALAQEQEALELAEDPEMAILAQEDIDQIATVKAEIQKQILEISEKEKEEERFPNELILEVRAGAGGDEAKAKA